MTMDSVNGEYLIFLERPILSHNHSGADLSKEKIIDKLQVLAQMIERINMIISRFRTIFEATVTNNNDDNIYWPDLISEVVQEYKQRCTLEKVELSFVSGGSLRRMRGNVITLKEIIRHLLTIAFQALESKEPDYGKKIAIKHWADDQRVIVEIKNNGPGIEKAIIDKIFEPFFTTKASGRGRGLGLTLVQTTVAAYNGAIMSKVTVRGRLLRFVFPVSRN
jgi:C4-dicarboxylate-specific signal transduction histidine kinase